MKVSFNTIILLLFSIGLFGQVQTVELSNEVQPESVPKKEFDSTIYNNYKTQVELIEELEKRKLKEDSSLLGKGYGVEHGKDYIIYTYDSITHDTVGLDKNRGPGTTTGNDGVNPALRDNKSRKEFIERERKKRQENINKKIREGKIKEREQELSKPKSTRKAEVGFSNVILYLLLAVALGFLIYVITINSNKDNSHKVIRYSDDLDPNKIQLSELEIQINKAKENLDFRLATRLYFVWTIKELSDFEFIDWKKRKTNYNYISELSSQPFVSKFKSLVKTYEYVWYGNYELSEADFIHVEAKFIQLINTIKTK